jgi:hypothetical protein
MVILLLHYKSQLLPPGGDVNALDLLPDTNKEMCPTTPRRQNQYCTIIIKRTSWLLVLANPRFRAPFQMITALAMTRK